ncbi:hypothetical protein J5N97_026656 [Dioscorea zingiberensis]|uniref:IspG C-terminal domain-containing protein n=1 Tax=Dioscorea zingiberensis TaxID=325984 RepID=A0A9D5C3K4_9LILI|nr:hypothetical protein J5N97_026656 [Dioscorea zingiberensis]
MDGRRKRMGQPVPFSLSSRSLRLREGFTRHDATGTGFHLFFSTSGDLFIRYLNACRKHEVQPNSSILSSCLKGIEMLSLGSFRIGGILLVNGLNVSCPSCGRTLFDLQEISAQIREKTSHLRGVSIAIMGCIVNRPGEMADPDFGYVGGAPRKIDLYVGKTG